MRSVLVLGLFIVLTTAAIAAPAHHARHQRGVVRPDQAVTGSGRFAVPGWSDEATQRWLDNASSGVGHGG
jgi:hypothetical protein